MAARRSTEQLAASSIAAQSAAVRQMRGPGGRFGSGFGVGSSENPTAGGSFGSRAQAADALENIRKYNGVLGQTVQNQEKLAKATKKSTNANRRQGVSFFQLLSLMAKFGIAMQIISLPGKIISGFMSIVKAGVAFEKGMADINSLVRMSTEDVSRLGVALQRVAIETGAAGDLVKAGKEAASSIDAVVLSKAQEIEGVVGRLSAEASTIRDMVQLAAEVSVAGGNIPIEDTIKAVSKIMAAFGITTRQAREEMDVFFNTVDLGQITAQELTGSIGEIAGSMAQLFSLDPRKARDEFRKTMAVFSAMTQTLGPRESATGLRNMIKNFQAPSKEVRRFTKELEAYGVQISLNDVISNGFANTIKETFRGLGPHGVVVNDLVREQKERGKLVDLQVEENFRMSESARLYGVLMPNVRGFRGMIAGLVQEGRTMNEFLETFETSSGAMDRALDINSDTVTNLGERFKSIINTIKVGLFDSLRKPISDGLSMVNKWLDTIIKTEQFQSASFTEKFGMLFDGIGAAAQHWMDSGGSDQIKQVFEKISGVAISVLNKTVFNPKFIDAVVQIGVAMGRGILKGMASGALDAITPGMLTKESGDKHRDAMARNRAAINLQYLEGLSYGDALREVDRRANIKEQNEFGQASHNENLRLSGASLLGAVAAEPGKAGIVLQIDNISIGGPGTNMGNAETQAQVEEVAAYLAEEFQRKVSDVDMSAVEDAAAATTRAGGVVLP